MKHIYDEIKDIHIKEVVPINSKDEVLIWEGRRHEDGLIKVRPYVKVTEINSVPSRLEAMAKFITSKIDDPSPLSKLDYTIIKENMLEGKISEMVFFLNNKLHWLAFRIERSIEYNENSEEIPNDVSRDLVFIVKQYDDISKIPQGTANASIIYMKEYSYITI